MESGYNIQWYDWQANTNQYPWARNPYENQQYRWYVNYSKSGSTSGFFNECGSLAKWMVDKGWRVDITSGLSEVQPGDIIFFAEKMKYNDFPMTFETMLEGYDYRGITHAAICTEVIPIFERFSGPVELRGSPSYSGMYDYQLTIITTPSFMEQYLRNTSGGWNSNYDTSWNIKEEILQLDFEYTNSQGLTYCLYSMDTIAMVCRPDLSSNQKTYLEQEAENLGLHTVPENETQLNIIKRCRICTDIEWTPGKDYDRVLPITGNRNDYRGWVHDSGYKNTVVVDDGQFKTGATYKGIPFTYSDDYIEKWNLDAFLSIIENEDAETFEDNNMIFPFYGWINEMDLLRFVFGNDSCRVDSSSDWYFYQFQPPKFQAIDTNFEIDSNGWMSVYNDSNELDYSKLKLGDILCSDDHIIDADRSFIGIITDIIKDSLGNVTQVELSEATNYGLYNPKDKNGPKGGLICRKMYTVDEFSKWYWYNIDRSTL